ncbi:hypothetical protein GCM10010124_05660 [Pilimelia terevasa]|uniref:Uncharacterized protein n=1 Tax=Pilimelia terevasa TaxID=53372 RepID=A0A8J3BI50_9ACTN|nr:type II toxin-antitoxin system PemK/MazF family toxin [Pilimelia terevasa]GGK15914.1 hypothetical protein GCM10010124_05660 [Pilimelia terevasa]
MRGDVHQVRRPRDAVGREQRGERYAIVVQATALSGLSTCIVCPTSASAAASAHRPLIDWGDGDTRVLAEQAMAVDRSRLGEQVGHLPAHGPEMIAIDRALKLVLGLP